VIGFTFDAGRLWRRPYPCQSAVCHRIAGV